MPELSAAFSSREEWLDLLDTITDSTAWNNSVIKSVMAIGYEEPISRLVRNPEDINILQDEYLESIRSFELNSRKRAVLYQLSRELESRDINGRTQPRILINETETRLAQIIKGEFSYCRTTDTSVSAFTQSVSHDINTDSECVDVTFDAIVFNDHAPSPEDIVLELESILSILKPGGFFIACIPFSDFPSAPATVSNAWELVEVARSLGFGDAYFSAIISSRHGIASNGPEGALVFVASKSFADGAINRPSRVASSIGLPQKLVTLLALPRSGTTLLTSVFAVHSQVTAIYEPWNSGLLAGQEDAKIDRICASEGIFDIDQRVLFIKETSAQSEYPYYIKELFFNTPDTVGKHSIVLIRQPAFTFLSEIARRNEWWGDEVELNEGAFSVWCSKARQDLLAMLQVLDPERSTVVSLDSLTENPKLTLQLLSARLGISFEENQLNYEKYVDQERIRGDLNVSRSPSKIAPSILTSRASDLKKVRKFAKHDKDNFFWFTELSSYCEQLRLSGGVDVTGKLKALTKAL